MASYHQLAERQHGVFSVAQSGLTRDQIAARVARGELERARVGVYRIGGSPPTWEQAVMAACLVGPPAWASHGTAARLWRLRHAPAEERLHVVTPADQRLRQPGVIAHRSTLLAPSDLTVHCGIPVLSVARTFAEIAGTLGCRRLGESVDDALRRRLLHLERLRACHARLAGPGRRRLRDLRRVLAQRLPGYDPGESDLEIRALRALVRGGLPVPSQQHRVLVRGRTYRLDLAYPEARVGIELLGWAYHGPRSAFDGDRARTTDLQADGWTILEFTSATTDEELLRVVRSILDLRAA